MIKIATTEAEEAFIKLRDIIMMPKNKMSMDVLKIWYTDDDAKVLSAGPFKMVMADRFTIEEYAKKSKLSVEVVRETFERLARRGVLFYYVSKRDGKKKYMIPPLFPGLVEYFIINKNISIDERRKFVKRFHQNELDSLGMLGSISDFSVFRIVPGTKPDPISRLIDINGEITVDKNQVLAYQDVKEIIIQAGKEENNIAVVPCTCRTMSMMLKRSPDCERTVENCLVFGVPTKYVVDEGIGHYITVDEALDILKQAEKEGLIHLTQNTIDKQGFICNCCTCCCGIVGMATKYNYWEMFQKTDYIPVIDMETCKKCKKCVNICPFYALKYVSGEKEDKSEDNILLREEVCIGCGLCASNCPSDSINLKKVRDVKPATNFIEAVTKMMQGKAAN